MSSVLPVRDEGLFSTKASIVTARGSSYRRALRRSLIFPLASDPGGPPQFLSSKVNGNQALALPEIVATVVPSDGDVWHTASVPSGQRLLTYRRCRAGSH